MKVVFEKWSTSGPAYTVLDLSALLAQGVRADVFLDGHQFYACVTFFYLNGEELALEFNDVHGRQEVAPSALKWYELEQEAEQDGEYKLDPQFYVAYEFLTIKKTDEGVPK